MHGPLPTSGSATVRTTLTDVWDKGKAAVIWQEGVATSDTGEELWTTRSSIFVRGEGGWGGDRGASEPVELPDRAPDAETTYAISPQQALLYRLCGDRNPLHSDPDFAKAAGFPAPILHGLCSYGIVLRELTDALLGGDATRVGGFAAKFAGVVYPRRDDPGPGLARGRPDPRLGDRRRRRRPGRRAGARRRRAHAWPESGQDKFIDAPMSSGAAVTFHLSNGLPQWRHQRGGDEMDWKLEVVIAPSATWSGPGSSTWTSWGSPSTPTTRVARLPRHPGDAARLGLLDRLRHRPRRRGRAGLAQGLPAGRRPTSRRRTGSSRRRGSRTAGRSTSPRAA